MWVVGLCAMLARMMAVLVSGYLVLQLTGSVFLTQMAGVSFLLPQVFMGVFTGVIADAFDRRKLVFGAFVIDALVLGLATVLVITETVTAWRILSLGFLAGVSFNVDMVARRTFVIDLVGRDLLPSAVPLDNLNMTVGLLLGPMIAGILLEVIPEDDFLNVATVYGLVTALYVVAAFLLIRVRPRVPQQRVALSLRKTFIAVGEGFRVTAGNRAIVGVLGITVLMNVSFFSFNPMIPVFAEQVLHVQPTAMGLLGGASGIGSIFGALFIATRRQIRRKSVYYYVGTLVSLVLLTLFAASTSFTLSFTLLVLAGAATSGFGAMQATLVLLSAREEMRGRAMGILSLAIGAEPIGGIMVGALAEAFGPGPAVGMVAGTGFVLTVVWVMFAKEMRKL